MGVTEAMLKLSLDDNMSSKITAIATSILASTKLMEVGWGAVTLAMGAFTGSVGAVTGAISGMMSVTASAGAQLFDLSAKAAESVNALDSLSKSLQVNAGDLQILIKAAGDMGIEQHVVTTGFRTLQMTIAQAVAGNESAIKSFDGLGVNFKDASGKARAAEIVMQDVGKAISKMGGGAGATAAAIDLLGRSGSQMIPLFGNWEDSLVGANESLDTFDQRLSKESVDAAGRFRKAMGDIGDAISAFGTYLGTSLMGTWADSIGKMEAAIKGVFDGLDIEALGIGIKLTIQKVVDSIPFEWLTAKVTALGNWAINQLLTVFGTVIRGIDAIPWWEVSKGLMVILPVVTGLVEGAWNALGSMARAGYTRAWDAAQAFIPMVTSLIGGVASKGVSAANTIALAFKTAASGAMELFQRVTDLLKGLDKVAIFLNNPSMKTFKAIQDTNIAQDKAMKEMEAGYRSLNNEDALWWAAMQQRADSFAVNAKTTTAPIVEAIDAARGASDKVVDAVSRAAQEMGNLKGATTLSAAQADILKKNFFMSGESAEALAQIAARLGIDIGKMADNAGKLAKETKDAAGSAALYLSEEEKRQAAEAKAAEEKAKKAKEAKKATDEAGAGGSGGGGTAGPRGGTTTTRPPIGTVISPDGTVTTTRIGGWGGYDEGRGSTPIRVMTPAGASPVAVFDPQIPPTVATAGYGKPQIRASDWMGVGPSPVYPSEGIVGGKKLVSESYGGGKEWIGLGGGPLGSTPADTVDGISARGQLTLASVARGGVLGSGWGPTGYSGASGKTMIRPSDWKPAEQRVDIGTYGQAPGMQVGQTDPRPADVNIDGEKVGQLLLKRFRSGAWTVPQSAVKDSR